MSIGITMRLVAILTILSGCTSQYSVDASIRNEMLSSEPANRVAWKQLYTIDSGVALNTERVLPVYKLSEVQRKHFYSWFNEPERMEVQPHKRLYQYIEKQTDSFSYNGNTLTAEKTAERLAGNCLSLAIYTAALADLADVDVAFQTINTPPVYRKVDDTLLLYSHVRVRLLAPKEKRSGDVIVLRRGSIVVDYFPDKSDFAAEPISREAVTAMFYRNLAVSEMLKGEFASAYGNMTLSMEYAPSDPENINAMAVLLNRMGYSKNSVRLYEVAIQAESENLNVLGNYALMLRRNNQYEKAVRIESLLKESGDRNPYRWIVKGQELLSLNKYRRANDMFKKALSIAPYLEDAHLGLAESYYKQNDFGKARNALIKASEFAWTQEDEARYHAKLLMLKTLE
ncbi:Tfp pilus assembly protein PilF [Alteromonas sp. 76-1]|uniref:tetratricopeptide repeat protein n=1 Tax=Alteromonas sp. 76-1 TaxID=2358187 RepID=UPI000FD184B6|nr:tetratricopeptide repeat protein [Alteromonas sp. 76-1]VEL98719.1 Tfp pilus assembly protein PilF [Alteromonas sp. 76-1]